MKSIDKFLYISIVDCKDVSKINFKCLYLNKSNHVLVVSVNFVN